MTKFPKAINFGKAVEALKKGKKVSNLYWDKPIVWIELITNKKNVETIYVFDAHRRRGKFIADTESILSDHWFIVTKKRLKALSKNE